MPPSCDERLTALLDCLDVPAIALDAELEPHGSNEAWERIVAEGWLEALAERSSRDGWKGALAPLVQTVTRTPGARVRESRTVTLGSGMRELHIHAGSTTTAGERLAIVTLRLTTAMDAVLDALPAGVVRRSGEHVVASRVATRLVAGTSDPSLSNESWSALLATDPRAPQEGATRTLVVPHADGSRHVLEVASRSTGPDEAVWLVRDVTERASRELEQARLLVELRRAHEQLERAFDAVSDAIVVIDAQGRVVETNREARVQFGLERASCVGQPLRAIATEPPWKDVASWLESTPLLERELIDAQTQRAWMVSARSIEGDGQSGRRVVVARDVSTALALQRSAGEQAALATMGALVGGVAHEVRNPLFGISAMLDLFEAELATNPEFETYVSALRSQVSRLSSLMQDLLEYGRPIRFVLAPTDVHDVIEDAVAASRLVAESLGVEIRYRVDVEVPVVPLDALRFGQALRNLLENACQHSPRGSCVTLAACVRRERAARVLEIEVRDRGPGFRAADLAHVFDPFFTRRRGGTGLGLAIVKRVVLDHHGEVFASNIDGGGANVTIRVPIPTTGSE